MDAKKLAETAIIESNAGLLTLEAAIERACSQAAKQALIRAADRIQIPGKGNWQENRIADKLRAFAEEYEEPKP
jgi:hypothetical protein